MVTEACFLPGGTKTFQHPGMSCLGVLSFVLQLSGCCSDGTHRLSYSHILWMTEDGMGLFEHCDEQNSG